MRNRVLLAAIAALLLPVGVVYAAPGASDLLADYSPLAPGDLQQQIDRQVVERLQAEHYRPVAMDDVFSARLLHAYLEDLDPTRSIFLASDIATFEARYGDTLDDGLRAGKLAAAFAIFNTYQERRIEINQWLLERVARGIDFFDLGDHETITVDRENAPWPADKAAQRALWSKRLENQIISMHLGDEDEPDEEDAEPAPTVQERLLRRYENELKQLVQAEPIDVVAVYMGAYTHLYDPHTDYFSPSQSENFEINMKLSLQGIGAQLRSRNGYTEIVRLIPGGPAIESGKLEPTDRIIAVGQSEEGGFVNIVGMRLDETVQLIRGKKGSVVRLRITSADGGQARTVSLVRDKIKLEAQAASKQIIEIERDGKTYQIGLITLPSFYQGTTEDVKRLLLELKAEDIAGIVIDLRNNGGGALGEVTDLVGLFMPSAPSVQIRDAEGRIQVLGSNSEPVYSGPLAVMVNRLSASASEIFAGAIQDFGRGIILGNTTFGKGTVQALMPLKKGRIKLTRAKFYRITGASTQVRGVTPDIQFPPLVDADEIGEGTLPNALPWDRIEPISYPHRGTIQRLVPVLTEVHQNRVAADPDFQYRVERIALIRERSERDQLSLNLEQRRARQQAFQQQILELANAHRSATGEKPFASFEEFEESDENESLGNELAADEPEEPDAYQEEAARILLDLIEVLEQGIKRRA